MALLWAANLAESNPAGTSGLRRVEAEAASTRCVDANCHVDCHSIHRSSSRAYSVQHCVQVGHGLWHGHPSPCGLLLGQGGSSSFPGTAAGCDGHAWIYLRQGIHHPWRKRSVDSGRGVRLLGVADPCSALPGSDFQGCSNGPRPCARGHLVGSDDSVSLDPCHFRGDRHDSYSLVSTSRRPHAMVGCQPGGSLGSRSARRTHAVHAHLRCQPCRSQSTP
ncbi:unannotated protein [freshwater metagenome]|uniref:Unannotated protein n=1 Tax=freshwater metagenome TaxID=449393 RepID=A0A6J7UU17_9ZZZZ